MTLEQKVELTAGLAGVDYQTNQNDIKRFVLVAESKIRNLVFPHSDDPRDIPERYQCLVCEAAAYLYNKRGAEGQTAHSENGVSRSYESGDLPSSIIRQITPHGRVW